MPTSKKKVSAKRLLVNHQAHAGHDAWSAHGLGLQDNTGAIRRELIDLAVPQMTVDSAVHACMHSTLPEHQTPSASQPDIPNCTCEQLFGHCRNAPHHDVADIFARQLAQETVKRQLPAGTLVRLKVLPPTESSSASFPAHCQHFLLGALCQRPLLQVLVKAWPVSQGESGRDSGYTFSLTRNQADLLPDFCSSFQIFRTLAVSCNGTMGGISVEVLPCNFQSHLFSVQRLEIEVAPNSMSTTFVLSKNMGESRVPKAAPPHLPFGMVLPKKKRKKQAGPGERGRGSRGRGRGRGHAHGHGRVPGRLEDQSSDSGDSDCDSSGSSAAELQSQDQNDDGDRPAGEDLAMPNAAAERDRVELAHAVSEFAASRHKRAELAEAHRIGHGSFFAREIGFDEASVAPTGRSKCYHCDSCIPKGSVRFAYFWHERRPSRYLHDSCVGPFVLADASNRKEQAVAKLRHIVQSTSGTNVSSVRSAAERVLSVLSPESAASSS